MAEIKLVDPLNRTTDANLRQAIDVMFKDTNPDEDFQRTIATICLFIDYVNESKIPEISDLKGKIKPIFGKTDAMMKKQIKAYAKKKGTAFREINSSELMEFDHTIAFPDQVKYLCASILLLRKGGPAGEKGYQELMRALDKLKKNVIDKYLTEGLFDLFKKGGTMILKAIGKVAMLILRPILSVFFKIIKVITAILDPIVSYLDTLFKKLNLDKLPEIFKVVGFIAAGFGYVNLWLMMLKVSGAIYTMGRILGYLGIAVSTAKTVSNVVGIKDDVASFMDNYMTDDFDLGFPETA